MRRRDEVAVGMLVSVSVAVLILGVLWLARGGLSSGYPLYTRFAWGQNLKQGQPVLLAGVSVGYVDNVELRPEGYLDVMMRINDSYHVPKGTVATVRAVGFFGDVAVALTPILGAKTDMFAPGDTIPAGAPEASVDQLMEHVDSISISLNAITRAMHSELIETGGLRDLRKTIATTSAFATQLQSIAAEQDKNLTATLEEFRRTAHSLAMDSALVDSVERNFRTTSANAVLLSARLDSGVTRFNNIIAKVDRGDGTVGKFLTDTALYSDMRKTMASMDSLLMDLKKNPRKYINLHIF